jgi:hypothetical protein
MKLKHSEAITAYVPKEMKARLLMLKSLDPLLHTTSKIVVGALELYLPIFEEKLRSAAKLNTRGGLNLT